MAKLNNPTMTTFFATIQFDTEEEALSWRLSDPQGKVRFAVWKAEKAPTTGKPHVHCTGWLKCTCRRKEIQGVVLNSPNCNVESHKTAGGGVEYIGKEETSLGPVHQYLADGCTIPRRAELVLGTADRPSREALRTAKEEVEAKKNALLKKVACGRGTIDERLAVAKSYGPKVAQFVSIVTEGRAQARAKYKAEVPLEVYIIYGPPGVGKSSAVIKAHCADPTDPNNPKIFTAPSDPATTNFWADGYSGEDILVLDEFDPTRWTLDVLNRVLDKGSYIVNIKGGRCPATWERVYILSNYPLDAWFPGHKLRETFIRRITKVFKVEKLLYDKGDGTPFEPLGLPEFVFPWYHNVDNSALVAESDSPEVPKEDPRVRMLEAEMSNMREQMEQLRNLVHPPVRFEPAPPLANAPANALAPALPVSFEFEDLRSRPLRTPRNNAERLISLPFSALRRSISPHLKKLERASSKH